MPAIIGRLSDYTSGQFQRLRDERRAEEERRLDEARLERERRLLSFADCSWTQIKFTLNKAVTRLLRSDSGGLAGFPGSISRRQSRQAKP
jgi:hypothetical protein